MTGSRITVFVDTTAIREAPRLERGGWPELLTWARRGVISVVVSEVVMLEADRHYRDDSHEHLAKLRTALARFEGLEEHGRMNIDVLSEEADERTAEFIRQRRDRLIENGVTILPLPQVSHEQLVSRDLARRKPFQESGKGYRDALAWESLLEQISGAYRGRVVLVSADGDYAESRDVASGIDPQLRAEVGSLRHEIDLVRSLPAAVDLLKEVASEELERLKVLAEVPAPGDELAEAIEDAVASAAEGLSGQPVSESRRDGALTLQGIVPSVMVDARLDYVGVNFGSLEVDVYDHYEGDTVAVQATIEAALGISGVVGAFDDASDLHGMSVVDVDDAEETVRVGVERIGRLRFYVTAVGTDVTSVIFDTGEPA